MIFTFMWALDMQEDWDYVEGVRKIFESHNTKFYYVELVASKEVRLARNITKNRLKHKPSKRDIKASNRRLFIDDEKHRFESYEGEIPYDNYIKIDNTYLSAEEVANIIKDKFNL